MMVLLVYKQDIYFFIFYFGRQFEFVSKFEQKLSAKRHRIACSKISSDILS